MKTAVLILAGGSGLRLWPLSKSDRPKQFLHIGDSGFSFLGMTVSRALRITDKDRIFVLTQKKYAEQIKAECTDIPVENIFAEPFKKNTAPAIATALEKIRKRFQEVITVVMPSDHYIFDEIGFVDTVIEAVDYCKKNDDIVTIGIPPVRPDTSFGYVKYSGERYEDFCRVLSFIEKPDLGTAKAFLKEKTYFWNSGIFVCKSSVLSDLFLLHLTDVHNKAKAIAFATNVEEEYEIYKEMPVISIDYGILEKTDRIVLLQGCFGWDDIGSWSALERLYEKDGNGNICSKNDFMIDSSSCTVFNENGKTLLVGADNVMVINVGDVLLVCQKEKKDLLSEIFNLIDEEVMSEML